MAMDISTLEIVEDFPTRIPVKYGVDFGHIPYTGCFLAGGALTSKYTAQPVNDYDLYPKTEKDRDSLIESLFEDGYYNYHASDRALTFVCDGEPAIQVMIFDVFPTAQDIFSFFDFTINMAAYDLDTKETIMHDEFLIHNSQRYLQFNPSTKFPYASAMRVKKYQERGYKINQGQMLKILKACGNNPLDSWESLKMQMGGIYGESIDVADDLPFTDENVFEVLDNLVITKNPKGYHNFDDYLINTDENLLYYKFDQSGVLRSHDIFNIFYKDSDSDEWITKISNTRPVKGREILDLKEIYPDGVIIAYKSVTAKNEKYVSHYKPAYEYVIGEDAVEPKSPYLFFKKTYKDAKSHYGYYNNSAVLRVAIRIEDITNMSELEIIAKKCKVLRLAVDEEKITDMEIRALQTDADIVS